MKSLAKPATKLSERVARITAQPVAFMFIGLVIGALGTNNLLKEQRATIEASALQVIAQSQQAALLPPPTFKGSR